ncbi:MAG: hypothetical protein J6T94_01705 [Bacteroidaceae bacterium]|nr:hypothetical protein [Bacteroidaceae bacterium]
MELRNYTYGNEERPLCPEKQQMGEQKTLFLQHVGTPYPTRWDTLHNTLGHLAQRVGATKKSLHILLSRLLSMRFLTALDEKGGKKEAGIHLWFSFSFLYIVYRD